MKVNRSPKGDRPGELRHDILGLEIEDRDGEQLRRIIWDYLPEVLQKFAHKHRMYGENTFPLGAAGQFPEIDRKVRLLRMRIWDKQGDGSIQYDTNSEVIGDLIGHLLLLLDCLSTPQPSDADAHRIREAKGGVETWVARDEDGAVVQTPGVHRDESADYHTGERSRFSGMGVGGSSVKQYPPDFKGRSSYTVGEVVSDPAARYGRIMTQAHGHIIRVAYEPDEKRCGWKRGNPDQSNGDNQCVGIEGHGKELIVVGGYQVVESYHINKDLEAWPV